MTAWRRALVWLLILVVVALILPGVDPYAPLLLGALLIVAFEIAHRRHWKRR